LTDIGEIAHPNVTRSIMKKSHQCWLHEQLLPWESEGVVTNETAQKLRERYALNDSQPALGQIVMGSLGALLIGAELIAVIGCNWDNFVRPVRFFFAFLPLMLTQLFSLRVLMGGDSTATWDREVSALLQALATGACIARVSQIYNLGGAWPDFLFLWFLLSLPLIWVLRSHVVAMFYLITIAIWSIHQVERGEPWQDSPLSYSTLLLGLLPFWPGWPPKLSLSRQINGSPKTSIPTKASLLKFAFIRAEPSWPISVSIVNPSAKSPKSVCINA
jgi:hypothetical protein